MGRNRYPQLTTREVQDILKARGFVLLRTSGSHEHWGAIIKDERRIVTVDLHGDFGRDIIKSMIRQSGLTREEFYCSTKKTAKRLNKEIDPEL